MAVVGKMSIFEYAQLHFCEGFIKFSPTVGSVCLDLQTLQGVQNIFPINQKLNEMSAFFFCDSFVGDMK